MTFEAITSIAKAEAEARDMIAAAEANAKQMLADTEKEGRAAIEKAVAMAGTECGNIDADARNTADKRAKIAGVAIEDEKTRLRDAAMSKMDDAADLVVERIIRG